MEHELGIQREIIRKSKTVGIVFSILAEFLTLKIEIRFRSLAILAFDLLKRGHLRYVVIQIKFLFPIPEA